MCALAPRKPLIDATAGVSQWRDEELGCVSRFDLDHIVVKAFDCHSADDIVRLVLVGAVDDLALRLVPKNGSRGTSPVVSAPCFGILDSGVVGCHERLLDQLHKVALVAQLHVRRVLHFAGL